MEIGDKEAKNAELYELDKGSKEYKYLMEEEGSWWCYQQELLIHQN